MAALQRELEAEADRGVGLAELLDYLHASNYRFARRNRLSDEQLDELSLWCWGRFRSAPAVAESLEAGQVESGPRAERSLEPSDSLLERIRSTEPKFRRSPERTPAEPAPTPEAVAVPEPVAASPDDPANGAAAGPAHDLWAGFRRTPASSRSRSRRRGRSAS